MKNILFISYTNFFGGAEYVLCDYLKDNHENDIYIYTTNRKNVANGFKRVLDSDKIFTSAKMNTVSIRRNPLKSMFNILCNLYKIHQIVKKHNIKIIYGNNTLDVLLITLYKKYVNKNVKTISHIHDILEKKLYINYIRKNSKYVDKFIVPSLATKYSLTKCDIESQKIEVIYNGISIKEHNNKPSSYLKNKYNIKKEKKLICCIGQVCKRKRQDIFIDIVNYLNRKQNKYVGIIIGQITDQEYYEKIRKSFNENIIFLGQLDRADIQEKIYTEIDYLLLTSDRDPLPTVIIEAMSKGVIVIARNVDGVSEIITDKIDGLIFSYQINIEEIDKNFKYIERLSDNDVCLMKKNAIKKIQIKFNSAKKEMLINSIIKNLN